MLNLANFMISGVMFLSLVIHISSTVGATKFKCPHIRFGGCHLPASRWWMDQVLHTFNCY
jgi:hypothetical protein